jgi:hypothetical protein
MFIPRGTTLMSSTQQREPVPQQTVLENGGVYRKKIEPEKELEAPAPPASTLLEDLRSHVSNKGPVAQRNKMTPGTVLPGGIRFTDSKELMQIKGWESNPILRTVVESGLRYPRGSYGLVYPTRWLQYAAASVRNYQAHSGEAPLSREEINRARATIYKYEKSGERPPPGAHIPTGFELTQSGHLLKSVTPEDLRRLEERTTYEVYE